MLKKLKSLFIIEEETGKQKPTKKAPAENESKEPTTSKQAFAAKKPSNVSGAPDKKFVNILLKAIEENNAEGFDYLEYKQSLQSLSGMEMDEPTRYKSAFAMAKTMGVTKTSLVKSASHYISILKNEESKFGEALKNQKSKQISDREQLMKNKQQSIVEKQKQIEKLSKEIDLEKAALEKLKTQINQSAAKVEATKERFEHAYHTVVDQIKHDLKMMQDQL